MLPGMQTISCFPHQRLPSPPASPCHLLLTPTPRSKLKQRARTASSTAATRPCRCSRSGKQTPIMVSPSKCHEKKAFNGGGPPLTAHWVHPEYPFPPHCPYAWTLQALSTAPVSGAAAPPSAPVVVSAGLLPDG